MGLWRTSALFLALGSSSVTIAATSSVPVIEAVAETDPIPFGTKDTDDAAIWLNPNRPDQSLILGTSKVEPRDGQSGGLGVYDLMGRQSQFLTGGKLNNVDVITGKNQGDAAPAQSWAVASNRTAKGVDVYAIGEGRPISLVETMALLDEHQRPLTPYGLCAASRDGHQEFYVTTKRGVVYRYGLTFKPTPKVTLRSVVNLASQVSSDDDQFARMIVEKSARAEGEMDELEQKLEERFALEGCAYDPKRDRLVVGMENLGIWTIPLQNQALNPTARLMIRISGSWTDLQSRIHNPGAPRLTDDIEGLDLFTFRDRDFLLVSTQGISELALFDLATLEWLGNFRAQFGDDPVKETDGVAVLARPMGRNFPAGVVVLHDDQNTAPGGTPLNANYKILSLRDILKRLNLVQH